MKKTYTEEIKDNWLKGCDKKYTCCNFEFTFNPKKEKDKKNNKHLYLIEFTPNFKQSVWITYHILKKYLNNKFRSFSNTNKNRIKIKEIV